MFTKETWYNQRRLYHVFLFWEGKTGRLRRRKCMKLKSKLIISFCIIMFVPIFLSLLFIAMFFRVQWQMIAQNIVVLPDYRGLFFDIVFTILLVLLLTAGMLMIWIYQSMVTPIRKLQVAANNIKEGNLDFTIDTEGAEQDEVNELCVAFEEMRRRLKENAEEKIASARFIAKQMKWIH